MVISRNPGVVLDVCSLMTTVTVPTPGTTTITGWLCAKASAVTAFPPTVSPTTSVDPRTPLQVASDSARINVAVTRPLSTFTSASAAELSATPFAPLVRPTKIWALRTPGTVTSANSAVFNPPLDGRSPVSDTGWSTSGGTLTKAPKAPPLYVTPA